MKKRGGLRHLLHLPGVNVELFNVAPFVCSFRVLVRKADLTHKPPDVFDRSAAVQPVYGHPAVRRDFDHGCGVAHQLTPSVFIDDFFRLRVIVTVNRFLHFCVLLSFLSLVPSDKYIIA